MPVAIEEVRKRIEEKYIGFSPSTRNVKPVHIANGLFRGAIGTVYDTKLLNAFVFWQNKKGEVPKGHELDRVYAQLSEADKIDANDMPAETISAFRSILKQVVNADDGVFLHKDRMESYSGASTGFVCVDRIHGKDGGELVAEWLKVTSSPLLGHIEFDLKKLDDPIAVLCKPLLDLEGQTYEPEFDFTGVHFLNEGLESSAQGRYDGLAEAAKTLAAHLSLHPNKLYRMRLAVLFASFFLIRHLANLESSYVPNVSKAPPFFLDFSEGSMADSPIARASAMSYIVTCQSIARFYAWSFGQDLKGLYAIKDLKPSAAPHYKKDDTPEAREIWELALADAKEEKGDAAFTTCGQAMYDILAQEAEGNPITFMRQLGIRSGAMYPPQNFQPTKRFALKQDMLEMLIRSSIGPQETLHLSALQERLWDRFGIIIGGRPEDEDLLAEAGITQADDTSLGENRSRFAARLAGLDFAHLLADGVFQVSMEAANV